MDAILILFPPQMSKLSGGCGFKKSKAVGIKEKEKAILRTKILECRRRGNKTPKWFIETIMGPGKKQKALINKIVPKKVVAELHFDIVNVAKRSGFRELQPVFDANGIQLEGNGFELVHVDIFGAVLLMGHPVLSTRGQERKEKRPFAHGQ
jgi:hypothetical protein